MIHDDYAKCRECGEIFYRDADEQWKKLCLDCWKASKAGKSRHDSPWCADCYERGVTTGRASAPTVKPALDKARLRELLQLCHPDKHAGSPLAQRVAQWLNEQRRAV